MRSLKKALTPPRPLGTPVTSSGVCKTPSKTQTDGRTDEETRREFVSLSVVSVSGVHPMGGRSAMLHRN